MADKKDFSSYMGSKDSVVIAYGVAASAHIHQTRKWTKEPEPYIKHPRRVAEKVYNYLITCPRKDGDLENAVCAALLHDVREDTPYPHQAIEERFGKEVYDLVLELTDPPFEAGMPRDHKFGITVKKWYGLSPLASLIKLADRLDNLADADNAPKKWLDKYLVESSILEAILGPRWPHLGQQLSDRIESLKKN